MSGATATGDEPILGTSRGIEAADGRRYAFADHHCFACGATNPSGMRLEIELGEARARTEWIAGDDFVGWSDKIHGGIVATLLDEVMAWAPSSFDSWAVTAEMSVRYRSPASPGERLVAEGRVTDRRPDLHRDRRGAHLRRAADRRGIGSLPRRDPEPEGGPEGPLRRHRRGRQQDSDRRDARRMSSRATAR